MRRQIFIWLFTVIGAVILCGITWLYLEVEEDTRKWNELCDPHRGYGLTTLNFKVLDMDSNKPLDSVNLIIRYGASGDKLVDTLLRQMDAVQYTFSIPQTDECEYYWAEVSHPQYYETLYQLNDTLRTLSLNNGNVNEGMVYLKPATQVKVRIYNRPTDFAADTLRLFVSHKEERDVIRDRFTEFDFQERTWAGYHSSIESGHDYTVLWVYQHEGRSDTTWSKFYAAPFDTVKVSFTLKQK